MNVPFKDKQEIWIVTDTRGYVHARIRGGTRENAQRVARAFFPEMEETLLVWHHDRASTRVQQMAKRATQITPELCLKHGIFTRTAGGGA